MADLLPPNSTTLERNIATVNGVIGDLPTPLRDLFNPATCPADILPWLAWAFSVDTWDDAWSAEQKRAAIANSIYVHQHKGTRAAVMTALEPLGYDAAVKEWHEFTPTKDPFTFGVEVFISQFGIPNPQVYESIQTVAESAKNVRSWMTFINVIGQSQADMYGAASAYSGETVTVFSDWLDADL